MSGNRQYRKGERVVKLPLTPREREVLELIAHGHGNRQIAEAWRISERTVEIHRQRVVQKFQARTAAHAVFKAVCAGILRLEAGDSK